MYGKISPDKRRREQKLSNKKRKERKMQNKNKQMTAISRIGANRSTLSLYLFRAILRQRTKDIPESLIIFSSRSQAPPLPFFQLYSVSFLRLGNTFSLCCGGFSFIFEDFSFLYSLTLSIVHLQVMNSFPPALVGDHRLHFLLLLLTLPIDGYIYFFLEWNCISVYLSICI